MKYLITIFLSFWLIGIVSSQEVQEENQQFPKLDSAIQLMNDSLYFKANEVIMFMLDSNKVLPDELCFYFGKSLFLSGYKDQSRAFLYKYLALKQEQKYCPICLLVFS